MVIAERTSFSSIDGGVMADGNERKVCDPRYAVGDGRYRRPHEPLKDNHDIDRVSGVHTALLCNREWRICFSHFRPRLPSNGISYRTMRSPCFHE